jgi:predicted alpha/beta-hydrolase family hydrolase
MKPRKKTINVPTANAKVASLAIVPDEAIALLVLAHGAGADMEHPFMHTLAMLLAARDVATLRYQFPYTQQCHKRPDTPARLMATVRAAIEYGHSTYAGLPLFAGGKSMGGRMTSMVAAEDDLTAVAGLVFLGFPLHAAGRPAKARGAHLKDVGLPMLFLQGSRDKLADLSLLEPLCAKLGRSTTLHVIDDADHSFHVPKRSGRTDTDVLTELADVIAHWVT